MIPTSSGIFNLGEKLEELNDMRNRLMADQQICRKRFLTPNEVMKNYGHHLSEFEKEEIVNYEKIYAFGKECAKLTATKNAIQNKTFVDSLRRYRAVIGDHIGYRYTVNSIAGEGTYAQVLRCTDNRLDIDVALKIMKSDYRTIYDETTILMYIRDTDPNNVSNCIRMHFFDNFRGFHYIVFDQYETDLGKYVRCQDYPKITMNQVSRMSKTILLALVFLKRNGIIHGDLKPSNILLNSADPINLKLADFGISTLITDFPSNRMFQSLYYRAPEMFCGSLPTLAIDMWSFGCIVAEMVLGFTFLYGRSLDDQFFLIQQMLGTPTNNFFSTCPRTDLYFTTKSHQPRHCIRTYDEEIDDYVLAVNLSYRDISKSRKLPGSTPMGSVFIDKSHNWLLNFLEQVLVWDGEVRLTPDIAMGHPFFLVEKEGKSKQEFSDNEDDENEEVQLF